MMRERPFALRTSGVSLTGARRSSRALDFPGLAPIPVVGFASLLQSGPGNQQTYTPAVPTVNGLMRP